MTDTPPPKAFIDVDECHALHKDGLLSKEAYTRALLLIEDRPDESEWKDFISLSLLVLGAGLTVSGIIYFFAYNWASLHRFAKFGITQGLIAACIAAAAILGIDRLSGKVSMLIGAILIGPMIGVMGQVYQTGSDPYNLFLWWAILSLGWVGISRLSYAWLFWLLIVNATLMLFLPQALNIKPGTALFSLPCIALNLLAYVLWSSAQQRMTWLKTPLEWVPRLILMWLITLGFWETCLLVAGSRSTDYVRLVGVIVIVLGSAGGFYYFMRKQTRDMSVLTMFLIGIIAVSVTFVFNASGKNVFRRDFALIFFQLGTVVLLESIVGAHILRRISRS